MCIPITPASRLDPVEKKVSSVRECLTFEAGHAVVFNM